MRRLLSQTNSSRRSSNESPTHHLEFESRANIHMVETSQRDQRMNPDCSPSVGHSQRTRSSPHRVTGVSIPSITRHPARLTDRHRLILFWILVRMSTTRRRGRGRCWRSISSPRSLILRSKRSRPVKMRRMRVRWMRFPSGWAIHCSLLHHQHHHQI
jgi:hypothetical protein